MSRALAGADSFVYATVLQKVYEKGSYDLVITGKQAQDTDNGQTGIIFAERLGLPCVSSSKENIDALKAACAADPTLEVAIDLNEMTVTAGDLSFAVEMPDSARHALLSGRYDPIKELIDNQEKIQATAALLSYVS